MNQNSVRWRRFTGTSYGVFCSLHKEVTVGVLGLAMLGSFDAKAQTSQTNTIQNKIELAADDEDIALMDSVDILCSQAPLQPGMGVRTTSTKVYGHLTDGQSRCIHYHSVLDVVANKCAICRKFYSCFKCHDDMENHKYGAIPHTEAASVMCGVCGNQFSYAEYAQMGSSCRVCKASFNPRCALHKDIYSTQGSCSAK